MKINYELVLFLLMANNAIAQWASPDSQGRISYNGGNVGIGIPAPSAKLHVDGGGAIISGGRLYVANDLTNDNNVVFVNSSVSGYGLYSKGGLSNKYSFHFEDQEGSTVILGNSYGVGIGTITPQYKLDVIGNGHFEGGIDVEGPANFSGGRLSLIASLSNDNNAAFVNTSTTGYGFYSQGGAAGKYSFHFLNQSGASVLYGGSDGNVGIGTIYPFRRLDVSTGANAFATIGEILSPGQWSGLHFGYRENNALYRKSALVFERIDNDARGKIHLLNDGDASNSSADLADARLTIDYDGDVGIGTTEPDAKLAVKGHIHTQEVRVDMTGAMVPDYVFEPSYNLPSLSDIESYIKQNKHLPDVPSAKEMEKNGVNLGEMEMLLLKKIEELTLYVIELKKENESIKQEKDVVLSQSDQLRDEIEIIKKLLKQ